MKAAFKKAKRRFKEQMMEKAGVSEKVSDPVFDEAYTRFQRWNDLLKRVEDAHSHLLSTMQAQSRASTQLSNELVALHFEGLRMKSESDTGFASHVDEKALKEPIERFARVQGYIERALDVPMAKFYRSEVIAHMRREQLVVPEIKEAVRHRQHVCLDYAAYKRKVHQSQSSSSVELQKRIDRERKLKETHRRLDDETKNLMKTFTALERRRPGLVYEDICNVLAMQVHYHRRAAEILEKQLPHYHEAAFPLVQLSVLTSQARQGQVSDFLLREIGVGSEKKHHGELGAQQDPGPKVPARKSTGGRKSSTPDRQHRQLTKEAEIAALNGRLSRRSSIRGFASTLDSQDVPTHVDLKHETKPRASESPGNSQIERLRTGMDFSKMHSLASSSPNSSGANTILYTNSAGSARRSSHGSRGSQAAHQIGRTTPVRSSSRSPPIGVTIQPPATPRGPPGPDAATIPPALPPRKPSLAFVNHTKPSSTLRSVASEAPQSFLAPPALPPPPAHRRARSNTAHKKGPSHPPHRRTVSHQVAFAKPSFLGGQDVAKTGQTNAELSQRPEDRGNTTKVMKVESSTNEGSKSPVEIVHAKHHFNGTAATELSFQKGDRIVVLKKTAEKGWWFGFVEDQNNVGTPHNGDSKGWFPSTYVEKLV